MVVLRLRNRVRRIRRRRGLTIAQLAEIAGVGVSTISDIERGAVDPTIWTVLMLSRALRVDTDLLFWLEEIQNE